MKHKYYCCGLLALMTIAAIITPTTASPRPVMSVDLGSEFIKIALVKAHLGMEIVLDEESSRKTRAIVAFRDEERHFASQAETIALKYPEKAVGFLMNIVGHQFDDPEVQLYRKRFPYYNLLKDEDRGTVLFKVDENSVYSTEEILAMLLERAKHYAENFAKHEIRDAVLTVPAFFNQAERRAVQTAAELAGINLLQLISDNAAVALNYGVFRKDQFKGPTQYYMFYDMGATSTVVTIVDYSYLKMKSKNIGYGSLQMKPDWETVPKLSVVGVGFDRSLGGLDFTLRLRTHLAETFDAQKKTTLKVEKSDRAMAKLLKEAERVKKVLSANTYFQAQVENLLEEQDLRAPVTRNEFEEMCKDLFKRLTGPIDEALKSSHLVLSDITDVILMGGGTRVPLVQKILMEYLGREELGKSINTDEAAAMGALYKATSFSEGFRVKKFVVNEANIYPISIVYERQVNDVNGTAKFFTSRHILCERMRQYPGKMVMTFTNVTGDFSFSAAYSDLHFLTDRDRKSFSSTIISRYSLTGVKQALSQFTTKVEATGIQAHFWMNKSGILTLDRVTSNSGKVDLTADSWNSASSEVSITNKGLIGNRWTAEEVETESTEDGGESADKHAEVLQETDFENGKPTEFISIKHHSLDVTDMSKKQVAEKKQRLKDLKSADIARVNLLQAKNELEAFIFSYQNKLKDGPHFECSTEAEREHLLELFNSTSVWFYGQSAGARAKDFKKKLNLLNDKSKDISRRAFEFVKRPIALKAINQYFENVNVIMPVLHQILNATVEFITREEVAKLETAISKTKLWLNKNVDAQDKLKPYEKPVLHAKQIVKKLKYMQKISSPIMDKLRKLQSMAESEKQEHEDETEMPETEETMSQETMSEETIEAEPATEEKGKTEL